MTRYEENFKQMIASFFLFTQNILHSRIVEKALTEGRIKLDEISVSKIIESQAAHYRHTQEELPYRLRKKEKRNEWIPKKRVDIREPIPFY
ncbi:hypothetical protein NE256_01545 [Enterococcus faecium]|uniref:hypothetical protein n=1 Tax=Enterococcus faecium TaxID=1352 RepID=UPI002073D42A|nr:hypothetical protein [Enterococcus faecium]MCM6871598.1 hypothetical protein [Enterococcus faecium]MCM6875144.1 hypothetical protein [Enterococcus faecium]